MKIALVILHADPARGGAERYTIDLAAALARERHDVSLLATNFDQVPDRVAQVRIDHRGVTRAGQYKNFLDSLDAHLSQTTYDIVHAMLPVRRCDVYHPHAGIAVAMAAPGDALLRPRRGAMANIERKLVMRDDGPVVLCLSKYVQRIIREQYPLPDQRLPILFNAVDLDRFDPSIDLPGLDWLVQRHGWYQAPVALMIAQDFERKGVRNAIRALNCLDDGALIIVGKDDPKPYRYDVESAGERVLFTGPTGNTRPYYRHSDFFVLPTSHDPCSLVVLEALAMGLPVISTRFNGACEIMTDGVHGYVLDDPNDVDALAEAMRKMLDPHRRATMAQACLELRPKLSYNNHLWSLLNIYREVLRSKATRATASARQAPAR